MFWNAPRSGATDPGAIASTSQPQTIVARKNTGEVINDETVGGEMICRIFASAGKTPRARRREIFYVSLSPNSHLF